MIPHEQRTKHILQLNSHSSKSKHTVQQMGGSLLESQKTDPPIYTLVSVLWYCHVMRVTLLAVNVCIDCPLCSEYGEVDSDKLEAAVDTFVRSCAGYSVATYVLVG